MRSCVAFLAAACIMPIVSACESPPPPRLEEGRWIGSAMPTGHPEERTDVYLRVADGEGGRTILVSLAGEDSRPARDIELTADTLKFVFDSPGLDVPQRCALGLQGNGSYEGLCAGGEGKSMYVTVRPPDPFGGQEA